MSSIKRNKSIVAIQQKENSKPQFNNTILAPAKGAVAAPSADASEEINVRLSLYQLSLPETFITQTSQRQFKIINKSKVKVSFKWCTYATASDETLHKARKINEITHTLDESSLAFRVRCCILKVHACYKHFTNQAKLLESKARN